MHVSTPLFLAIALAGASEARASDPAREALQEQISRLDARATEQQAEIDRLRRELDEVMLAQQRGRGMSPAGASMASPQAPPAGGTDESIPQVGEARRAEQQAERRDQQKALVVREHAPLFERRFTLDTGFSYSYYDRRQLALSGFLALDAIFLGTISLEQTKATVFTADVTGRYGLTDRLSIEADIPYLYRNSSFISGGAGGASGKISEIGVSSSGIGDASVAAYYQLVRESARWPDLVASLRVRAPTGHEPFGIKLVQPDPNNNNLNVPASLPTGTGMWGATFNVSALRTYDPVILFGSLGYTYNVPRNFSDISPVQGVVQPGRVELGNAWLMSGGVAIALNDRSAISFSVASSIAAATHTKLPGGALTRVPGSSTNTTTLNIGASYILPSGWTLNGQLAAGLTPDAPNFVFSVRAEHPF